jgi:hypothetical protein
VHLYNSQRFSAVMPADAGYCSQGNAKTGIEKGLIAVVN